MQKQQLVGALGLLWKRVDEITLIYTKIGNKAHALALQLQVRFTNVEWDELKVHDTVICASYISSGKHFFKPAAVPSYQRQPSSPRNREGNVRFPTNLHGVGRSGRPTSM